MHLQKVIEQLGFHSSEAKIYLAALRIGDASISELASKVNMPRTTVTQIAEQMHKHGLLNFYTKHGKRLWSAENPDKLLITFKEREAALRSILPSLHGMHAGVTENKPSIKVYEGTDELKLIFDDIITTHHNILALISWDDIIEIMGQDFLDDFIERRYKSFLKIRLITPPSMLATELRKNDMSQLRHTRFLPSYIELKRISNFIYDNKVVLISLNKKIPTGTVIEDPDIVHAMTIYFESLWLQCNGK